MSIYSKGNKLVARHLRQLNGLNITRFDGVEGKINYPYIIMIVDGLCHPININAERNFKQIQTIKNGTVTVAARKNSREKLTTTGKGVPLKQRYY
ncbi:MULTISPECIES: hypothetical protein [unclassified Lactococcus]|uniref:hypothetical protein n=1 Tax=unclassified Lactococcus TaxID=2643510 RepID=UPI0011C7A61F|nr:MULTISPECIES: hypothetical protein [unclassified Lactococcus]MQW24013.1 hypothetical protein [Lactococcus sp. dk101]TXK36618.1 hypothetical protein FVP42_11100 [Lactococcus sp. dk310]TXK46930.1 hypothetical protein FVP43_10705 [Lactococcus sp. dk322]